MFIPIPIEKQGQRVLTTELLADRYGATIKMINNNFLNNKYRFIIGKHYFCVEGEELRALKRDYENLGIAPNLNKLYLWTEKGAWLHAKSLGTDQAWEAYEMLVDDYYRIQEALAPMQELSPQLQLLIKMEIEQKQIKNSIAETKAEVQGIRDVVALNPYNWREDTKNLIIKMAQQLGGLEHMKDLRTESYQLLDTRFGVNLRQRLINKRRRMAEEGASKSKRDNLNHLDVIADDKKLIEGYIAIVKEMAIKYGATREPVEGDE